jgi:hypothetical protein
MLDASGVKLHCRLLKWRDSARAPLQSATAGGRRKAWSLELPGLQEAEGQRRNDRLCLQQTEAPSVKIGGKTNDGRGGRAHLDVLHALLDLGAHNLTLKNFALPFRGLKHLMPLFWCHLVLLYALNSFAPFQCPG